MATERLIIEINEKGALAVKRNLDDIGKSAQKAGGMLPLLQRALGLLGGAMIIRQLVTMADEFTNIQNRLKMVTNGQDELNAVTEELFAISNRARSSFAATAEMYSRVGLAAKTLGKSQLELLQFTESLNQAIIMSGASAGEAQAGMIQLSQGLASGALRGDEFRAVSEQMPVVLDVIAKSMGTNRTEMRRLGAEGKITAEAVLKAFKEAREELAEKFAKTVPTVGQALTVLKNNAMALVGGISSASGASSSLAGAILAVAKVLPNLKEGILQVADVGVGLGAGIAGIFRTWGEEVGKAYGSQEKVIGAWKALWWTLLRTVAQVVDLVIGIISGLATALVASFASIGKATAQAFSLDWKGASETMKEGGQLVIQSLWEGLNYTNVTTMVDKVINDSMAAAAKRAAEAKHPPKKVDLSTPPGPAIPKPTPEFDKYLKQLVEEGKLLQMNSRDREIYKELFKAQTQMEAEMSPARVKQIEETLRSNQALADKAQLLDQIRAPQEEYNRGLAALEALKPQLGLEEYNAQLLLLKKNLQDARPEFEKQMEILKQQAALSQLEPREAEIKQAVVAATPTMTPEQLAQYENQLRINQALADQAGILDEIRGPQRAYAEGLAALNAIKPQLSTEEYNRKLRDLKTTLADATNQIDVAGEVWGAVWSGATTALDSFVETGKLSFSDLAGSILMDIQKIIAHLLLMKAFQAIGIPIPGAANGASWMVRGAGGTDSQLVAFKATPGERVDVSTPAQQRESAPGSAASVPGSVIKIINVLDPAEISDAMGSPDGEKVIINVISRNKGPIRQVLG
jgi:tape measure domain-containing protein